MNGILAHVEMAPNDFRRVDANRRYEAEARAVAKQAALADYITDDFEQRFEKHLCDAIERARPLEYRKHFDGFKEFARGHGLAFLPALPALAAGYLLHLAVHKRTEMDDIRLAYRAIAYAHDLAELFMDRTYLDAAMAVIAEIGSDGGGGQPVVPLTPIGNQIISGPDEMPLAAGGA
jgi:hypothetical protein